MNWPGLIVQAVSITLQVCVLVLLWRRALWGRFPFFTGYVAYDLLRTIVGSATLSHPIYFYVYWITAPLEMILMVLAAHESFLKVFRSFYLLWWFRVLVPGAIVAALGYSAYQGYASPSLHASPAGAAIISAALTAQYSILAIAILFFALAMFLRVPWRIHEYRFMLGFALAALAVAFGGTVRSVFGTNFQFLSEMFPAVVYILTLAVWLSAVLHAEPSNRQVLQEQVSGEQVIGKMRHQTEVIRAFLKKG
jgi:hypothetical protein